MAQGKEYPTPLYGRIKNASELGQIIRVYRKNQHLTLEKVSGLSGLGMRFLSELERGKETAELGKVLEALHKIGLEVTIQPRGFNKQQLKDTNDIKLAMSVGDEFNPDKIKVNDWKKMAEVCAVREQYLKKMILEMCGALLEKMLTTEEEFEASFGPFPALQRIRKVINKQCKRTLKQFLND